MSLLGVTTAPCAGTARRRHQVLLPATPQSFGSKNVRRQHPLHPLACSGLVRPGTAADLYRTAALNAGSVRAHTPSQDFFKKHFASQLHQVDNLMTQQVPADRAGMQAADRQRPSTTPACGTASGNDKGHLSAADRLLMQQAVASKLKVMSHSLREGWSAKPTWPAHTDTSQAAGTLAGSRNAAPASLDLPRPAAQQQHSSSLQRWRQDSSRVAPQGGRAASLTDERPASSPSGTGSGLHRFRAQQQPEQQRPLQTTRPSTTQSTSAAALAVSQHGWMATRFSGASSGSHSGPLPRPHQRLGLGAASNQPERTPTPSLEALAQLRAKAARGNSEQLARAAPVASVLLPSAANVAAAAAVPRLLYAPSTFAQGPTQRITTKSLRDAPGCNPNARPSRGTIFSVYQDLDKFGENRVTFSMLEQAAVDVGMKKDQVQRLFRRLDPQGRGYATVQDWGRPELENLLSDFTRLFVRRTRGTDGRYKDTSEVQSLYAALQMALFKLQLKNSGRSVSHERLVQAFQFIDRDSSGALDSREVLDAFNGMGIYLKDGVLQEAMRTFDKDGNGTVDYAEFVSTLYPNLSKGCMA